jgi:hypothetical protein
MNRSLEICVECEHRFPPGAPEPSWCPCCGRLCSASDEAEEPADVIEPFGARAFGRIFWIIFLGAPVVAVVAAIVPQSWMDELAAKLGLPLLISPAGLPMAALIGGVACSGWVLGSVAGRTFLERTVMTVFGAALVAMIYYCLAEGAGLILGFWQK